MDGTQNNMSVAERLAQAFRKAFDQLASTSEDDDESSDDSDSSENL